MSNLSFQGVRLAGKPRDSLWDIKCSGTHVSSITPYKDETDVADGRLVTPGLCHAHIHLDKCFLLSHPRYTDLEIEKGDFDEAMKLTSKAKSRFSNEDLMERGAALIEESISYGVTHMRAFVEVDPTVKMKCLDAGLALKKQFENQCHVQICAFAQDPLYSQEDGGEEIRHLMETAAVREGVDVVGSTPYVEESEELQRKNIEWMIDIAALKSKHLDFHLDYNLDPTTKPMVHFVIECLEKRNWGTSPGRGMVTLGHCTRLTLFSKTEWKQLRTTIGDLPVSFVGLPTSDLFMMGRVEDEEGGGQRTRGTLQIPQMINEYGLQVAMSINNVGNAFTPQGSCDPLSVTALGVAVYQAGTKNDASLLLQCISTRARAAIGLSTDLDLNIKEGQTADFVLLGQESGASKQGFRYRTSVQEIVYDACKQRETVFHGQSTSR